MRWDSETDLNYQAKELRNIVAGAALLGAGGGGSPVQGNAVVSQIIDARKKIEVVDSRKVPDDALVAVVAGMGAPSASKRGWRNEHLPAIEMFNKNYSRKIDYLLPFEIGAGNSAVPLHGAAFTDTPVVDGDGAGRAVPELQLTTFDIYGVPISPMSVASADGEGGMIFAKTALAGEKISRAMTQVFGNNSGIVLYPMMGSTLKKVVSPDTYALCEKAGSIINRLKPSGEKISEKLQQELGMTELGRGVVAKKVTETRGGFDYGHSDVKGKKDTLRVLFKNENIIALKNGNIITMFPDLICWLSEDGDSLTNTDMEEGRRVIILGLAAHNQMRTEKAQRAFKPLYVEQGRNEDYQPLERLI